MTLSQIRDMFEVGQRWEATNSYNPKANGPRTLVEKRAGQLVWATPVFPRAQMTLPKQIQVIDAQPGKLVFRIHEAKHCNPQLNTWSVDDTLTLTLITTTA